MMKPKNKFQHQQTGFSLLEVLVAMAIVGMVLGTIFSLLAGSKRLAFRALDDVERTIFLRSTLNAIQVLEDPEYPLLPERYKEVIELSKDDPLEKPERQTKDMRLTLEPYILYDKEKGIELKTMRLIISETSK